MKIDNQGTLHLAWFEAGKARNEIFYATAPHQAMGVTLPIHVNKDGDPVSSLHQPPALALGPDQSVYITWSTPHPQGKSNPFASLLKASRWAPAIGTFTPPVTVNDDAAPTSHSFDNLCVSPSGTLHVSWIDERLGHGQPKTMTTRSDTKGLSFKKNLALEGMTCVCCRTAMTTAPDGTIYVSWRQTLEGNVRETVVARSTDNGRSYSSPVIVGHDQWVFPACPHRPSSIGVDGQGRLYVVWYTEGPDETPGIYFAMSDNQGQTFSPRRMLNRSKGTFPDKPHMAVDPQGRILVVWEELSPVRHEVFLSYSEDRGNTFTTPQRLNQAKGEGPVVSLNTRGQGSIAWNEHAFPNNVLIVQPVTISTPHSH
ncbi:sialidase family protein [Candidatus Nitronereus thalassa]|uniref:Sialidase family protein n=1 Tax=Candidatus Nitronereus thalassa TaxID=3020898 RepID=A0ABU3KBP4_9BACT|nr:sialidase family protein [Candidatus Nitronereus thalassa]MDT7043919.1 sialidase family protein [Candidatus Nitronereus thalassa]